MIERVDTPSPVRGRLFYVMGASGAGKDSILHAAARQLSDAPVHFARRRITRARTADGEDHVPLSPGAFARAEAEGAFLFSWSSHGHSYGIPAEVCAHLRAGRDVVVNGSRGYLPQAQQRVPSLVPVVIRVRRERLAQRLRHRGREDEAAIARRLERASAFPVPPEAVIIDNNDALAEAVAALCRLLRNDAGAVP